MEHYSKEELDLYRNGEMSVLGRIACTAHLAKCPECLKKLRELEEDDRFIARLRSSVNLFRTPSGTPTRSSR